MTHAPKNLSRLIEAHRSAWDAWMVEVDYHMDHNEVREAYHGLLAAEKKLFLAVCSHHCRTADEARMKAEYLIDHPNVNDWWGDATGAKELIKSLLPEAA
jgi:hypothetical protein